jgi:argonaute-like protein implicated in RNA metabolism and viral defense
MLATLSYKLCFLYYNTVGSIKIPAPIHYVNKLSDAVHENAPRNEKIYPHQHYGKIKSLYFI